MARRSDWICGPHADAGGSELLMGGWRMVSGVRRRKRGKVFVAQENVGDVRSGVNWFTHLETMSASADECARLTVEVA